MLAGVLPGLGPSEASKIFLRLADKNTTQPQLSVESGQLSDLQGSETASVVEKNRLHGGRRNLDGGHLDAPASCEDRII